METVKKSLFALGWGGNTEDFYGSENSLYDITVMDKCHFMFAQTHRIYKTKSEPSCKLWTLGYCQCRCVNAESSIVTTILLQWLVMGEGVREGAGGTWEMFVLSAPFFSVNLKFL